MLYIGQCSFSLTVSAFRCPLSVYFQIDSGCGNCSCVHQQKIHFLGTNPPTQSQEVCQRHLSSLHLCCRASHLSQLDRIVFSFESGIYRKSALQLPTMRMLGKEQLSGL